MGSERVVGIVLGAGESKRFGSAKLLLPFGDTTLLGQAVRNANASSLDTVVVVLGRAAGELRQSLEIGGAMAVDNTAYGEGCASSLLTGLDVAGDCAAIMLSLGDQPGVTPGVIDQVVSLVASRGSLGCRSLIPGRTRSSHDVFAGSLWHSPGVAWGQGRLEADLGTSRENPAGRDRRRLAHRCGCA